MDLPPDQEYPPSDEEHYDSPPERPLTPALLLWRLWRRIRRRPRLFQRVDEPEPPKKGTRQATARRRLPWGLILVRLLPAWILLAVILVLAPGLPLRVGAAVIQFVRNVTRPNVVVIVLGPTPAPVPPLSPIFTPEVEFWEEDIAVWSQTYQIDPDLIATLMQIESCGDPGVVSSASASGLFQVTSIHFEPGEDHMDPQTNARAGLTFFAYLMELSGGNVGDALAGYNAGEWAVDAAYESLPDETQRYVYWGTGIYEEARSGTEESARLNEWLEAGGVRLCEGAAARLGLVPPPTPEAGG